MGRDDEPTFSILYEFQVSMSQINDCTKLNNFRGGIEHRELRFQSCKVPPESFVLLCRYLNGDYIDVTEANVSDLTFMGRELGCHGLLNQVKEFKLKTKDTNISKVMEELDEGILAYKSEILTMNLILP